jgi:aminobenzoyl-glutamate utilization protein B
MATVKTMPESVKRIAAIIEQKRDLFIGVSEHIWEFAETRYEEVQSAELISRVLEQEGFEVQRAAGGIPTAVVGSYGQGEPVIAILGEYDALSSLSQVGAAVSKEMIIPGGNGHGCGHHLLGSGALAAAVAVRHYMEELDLPGTIRYYGCPAEEGGGGKGYMVRNGLFNDVAAALTWHPGVTNYVNSATLLATCQIYFKFKGRSAHAAGSPHLGRSALDAVELMNVGANYLREHLIPEARLHYAITNAGGISPNVVQSEAEVLYKLRVPHSEQLSEMYERVCSIARGAALMMGTELEISFDSGSSEFILNTTLERLMHEKFEQLGVHDYDETEESFAVAIRSTLTEAEKKEQGAPNEVPPNLLGHHLSAQLEPYRPKNGMAMGSSDFGDVSWQAPSVQLYTACMALGTALHTWQVVSQGTSSFAYKGMLQAGKVLGATAIELLQTPEWLDKAAAEHRADLKGRTYKCPIPDDTLPAPVRR